MVDAQQLGLHLRGARRALRLSQTVTGQYLDVTRQTIAAYEAGKRQPSISQITALANLFRLTPDELLGVRSAVRVERAPEFLARAERGGTIDDVDQQELLSFDVYLRQRGRVDTKNDFKRTEFASLEAVVKQWREHGRWQNAVPVPVFEMLAHLGVEVRFTALESLAGAYIPPTPERAGGVLINSNQPYDRERYTAGHELGHIVLGHTVGGCKTELGRHFAAPEVQADRFASELLVPAAALRQEAEQAQKELNGGKIEHLVLLLARRFLVSFQAMSLRLDHLGALSPDDLERLEKAKPMSIEKELGERLGREDQVPFASAELPALAERALGAGWQKRASAESVRLLQTVAYSDYISRVSEGSRADTAGTVYEKVALWVATSAPLV